jgi:hypothetical protein
MVNTILLKHKTLGSAALRCGASQFGVKNMGSFSKYPSLFVAVFKTQEKRSKFLSFLRSQNLIFQTDYYYKYAIHKNAFVYMVFVKLYKFIPSEKIGFNSFKQLCSSKTIQNYSNPCYFHPQSNNNKKSIN